MIFSKSFGYAVRGVLYIAMKQDDGACVHAEEVATKLAVPRHFISKILKRLVKAGVLSSLKGKAGGFMANERTTGTQLITLFELTDGGEVFDKCSLRLQACNSANPCPLHVQIDGLKQGLRGVLNSTTIGDLLLEDKEAFVKSLTTLH